MTSLAGRTRLRAALCGLVLSLWGAVCVCLAQEPGELLANGDFEVLAEGRIPGWRYSASDRVSVSAAPEAKSGKRCLRIRYVKLPEKRGYYHVESDPFRLEWGKTYRLSGWIRAEGFGEGVLFSLPLDFKRADGEPFPHRREYRCIYVDRNLYVRGGEGWQRADLVFSLPKMQKGPELEGRLSGLFLNSPQGSLAAVYLDGFSLRELAIPGRPEHPRVWQYPATRYGQGGRFVEDEGKEYPGKALYLQNGVHGTGTKYGGPNIYSQPPGIYKITYRFKVRDNRSPKPVIFVDYAGQGMLNSSCLSGKTIFATDLAEPNRYQEFSIYGLRGPFDGVQYRFTWYEGITDVWFDGLTVTQLKEFQDRDLPRYYPLARQKVTITRGKTAMLLKGLFSREWHVEEALEAAGFTDIEKHYFHRRGSNYLEPPLPEDFCRDAPGLVVMSDVDGECLGFAGRFWLSEYVRQGGRLVILGGLSAFGRGGYRGSFLADVLPFQIKRTFDLVRLPAPGPIVPADGLKRIGVEAGGLARARAVTLWIHDVGAASDQSETYLRCGSRPFMIGRKAGEGAVLCCTGAPLGVFDEGAVAFWEWQDWPQFLAEIIRKF